MTSDEKNKLLLKADIYDRAKDEVGKETVNNLRFLKADLSGWYNALTTVCFTVGAIAITVGADRSVKSDILHPGYFWWGTILLITDGILIFFLKKSDIEGEFNEMPKLTEAKADYWQLRNMTLEKANGDNSRAIELIELERRVTKEYVDTQKKWPWHKWVKQIIRAGKTDIVFGVLLFSITLMLTQILDELHIHFKTYNHYLVATLILYALYTAWGGVKGVRVVRRQQAAEARIKKEILKE